MSEKFAFIAAIEVGSHETILKIAEITNQNSIKEIESVSRTINLGSDSYRYGYITNENIHLLIETLKDFKGIIASYPHAKIIAAATSALREATNQLFLLDQVENRTGIKIRVLSNREEMAGMNSAIRFKMPKFNDYIKKPTLLLDIGAGSTQLTLFDKGLFVFTQNILLGSLRVRDRLAVLEQHTLDFKALMKEYITGDLDYYRTFVPKRMGYHYFILVGNMLSTWRYLAKLELMGTVVLEKQKFDELYEEITNASTFLLIQKYEISEEQASILLPMSMVIKELFEVTKVDSIVIPDVSLADGILINMAEDLKIIPKSNSNDLDAISFAKHIAKRHHTDIRHIKQVERLSLLLFDKLEPEHKLSPRYRFLLQIAAIFHNIGKFFTVKQDGDIAYQLIKSTDISGMTDEEVELVAQLVKHHSKPIQALEHLDAFHNQESIMAMYKLSVILSMANALDTGHKLKVKNIDIEIKKKKVKLYIESNQEITLETWSFQKPAKYFYEVFGKEVNLIKKVNNK